jgi:hypothetical protein
VKSFRRRVKEMKSGTDWEKLNKLVKKDFSILPVVARFKVGYKRGPEDFLVEVIERSDGACCGVANYEFWGPGQALPYRSMHVEDTVEAALVDALSAISNFDREDYPNDCVFWVKMQEESWKLVDGDGHVVSKVEAEKKRRAYSKKSLRKHK